MVAPGEEAAAPRTLGVLLAGGRGLRLGAGVPKALVVLGGETLLARARRTLGAVCDEVVVVAPRGVAERLGVDGVVEDSGDGPLGAMVAAFAARRFGRAVVLGVDFPLVRPATLAGLLEALGAREAAIPVPAGRAQPLVAAYARRGAEKLAGAWGGGERSAVAAAASLDAVEVGGEALRAVGGAGPFLNLNTPEELEEAARSLAASR